MLRKKAEVEERNRREKEIRDRIEARFCIMNSEKKKMLTSLLNKPYSRIKIDKVLRNKADRYQNEELIVEGEEVKEYVVEHFEKQFRERNHKFKEINEE